MPAGNGVGNVLLRRTAVGRTVAARLLRRGRQHRAPLGIRDVEAHEIGVHDVNVGRLVIAAAPGPRLVHICEISTLDHRARQGTPGVQHVAVGTSRDEG